MMQPAEEGTLWYALHVRTRFEKVVARNLKGKGYEEFLPLYRRANRWSDRIKQIELPLFPGYVFCKFDPQERLPILTIPGVNSVVGSGKNLLPIDESELTTVRAVLKSENLCEPWPFLEVGQRVRVEYGPLAGTEGLVLMAKNTYRLVISVNMLQRSVAVEIDRECLKPIDRSPASTAKNAKETILVTTTNPEELIRARR
jgi:transcription antitermination factor NusG